MSRLRCKEFEPNGLEQSSRQSVGFRFGLGVLREQTVSECLAQIDHPELFNAAISQGTEALMHRESAINAYLTEMDAKDTIPWYAPSHQFPPKEKEKERDYDSQEKFDWDKFSTSVKDISASSLRSAQRRAKIFISSQFDQRFNDVDKFDFQCEAPELYARYQAISKECNDFNQKPVEFFGCADKQSSIRSGLQGRFNLVAHEYNNLKKGIRQCEVIKLFVAIDELAGRGRGADDQLKYKIIKRESGVLMSEKKAIFKELADDMARNEASALMHVGQSKNPQGVLQPSDRDGDCESYGIIDSY